MYNQTKKESRSNLIIHCKKVCYNFGIDSTTLIASCVVLLTTYSNHLWTEWASLRQDLSEPQHWFDCSEINQIIQSNGFDTIQHYLSFWYESCQIIHFSSFHNLYHLFLSRLFSLKDTELQDLIRHETDAKKPDSPSLLINRSLLIFKEE